MTLVSIVVSLLLALNGLSGAVSGGSCSHCTEVPATASPAGEHAAHAHHAGDHGDPDDPSPCAKGHCPRKARGAAHGHGDKGSDPRGCELHDAACQRQETGGMLLDLMSPPAPPRAVVRPPVWRLGALAGSPGPDREFSPQERPPEILLVIR